jgi:heat shock protein HslJ
MKSIFKFSIICLLLAGCGEAVEENESFGDVGEIIGFDYNLALVKTADKSNTKPNPGDMTMRIDSRTAISGKILCNTYSAVVDWSEDGNLIVQSWSKSTRKCEKEDPLVLDLNMKYKITDEELMLESTNGTWSATFLKVTEE